MRHEARGIHGTDDEREDGTNAGPGRGDDEIDASDEQLVQEALRGSDGAFAELVGRYRDGLFRFLLARCASRADAEDALQEALVNAWRYLQSYDARWRFSTWLYRIALRKAGRLASRPRPVPDPTDTTAGADTDPLAECIEQSARENLWLVARRVLSREAYAVMWMVYAEDLPVADAAHALGRSRSWARVTLMRSRRRLGRALGAMAHGAGEDGRGGDGRGGDRQ